MARRVTLGTKVASQRYMQGADPSLLRSRSSTPSYAPLLDALHGAQQDVLLRIVSECGISSAMSVVDVGSGDGFFAREIAGLVGMGGRVVGVDKDANYLELARQRCSTLAATCSFVESTAEQMPFEDATFDVAFSALSFFDFEHPKRVIQEMARVTKPGGKVVVVEQDSSHQAVLPWPSALDAGLSRALKLSAQEAEGPSSRFVAARRLPQWLTEANLEGVQQRSYTKDMTFPLSLAERKYVNHYLDELMGRCWSLLTPSERHLWLTWRQGLAEPPNIEREGFSATFIHFVTSGRV